MPYTYRLDKYDNEIGEMEDYMSLLEKLEERLKGIFTISGNTRSVRLTDVTFDMPEDVRDYRAQLEAKDSNSTYSMPVRGTFVMLDSRGKPVDKITRIIMRLPLPTGRGTFLINGSEYGFRKQPRLLPGAYTTEQEDGVQTFINTSARQNIKLHLDPKANKFVFEIGTKTFPMMAVLKGLGVDDSDIRKTWGNQIYLENDVTSSTIERTVNRLYDTMFQYGATAKTYQEKQAQIRQALAESALDPWTTTVTMGKPYIGINGQMLLRSTEKMLNVSAGKERPDRRDAIYFKGIFGFDDAVAYALDLSKKQIQKKLQARLDDPAYDAEAVLARPIENVGSTVTRKFQQANLSFSPDQINPIGMKSDLAEVTFMGEGGISSPYSVAESTRKLDDSTMGFLDPVHTPTSDKMGVNQHLAVNARKAGGRLVKTVWDIKGNRATVMSPQDLYDKIVAIPGSFTETPTGAKPKKSTVYALYKGDIIKVPASKVQYTLGEAYNLFDSGVNLIPFLNHNIPIRSSMSVKQSTHALPLKYREPALVQNVIGHDEEGKPISADSKFYNTINRRVPHYVKTAIVKKIKADEIWLEDKDGQIHKLQIYNHFPLNGDTELHDTPVVKEGDTVRSGQVLTENNFSKDGVAALGVNLRIAYSPFKGTNFMDGLVISESAAKKLTAERVHLEGHQIRKNDIFNKAKFIAHYPNLYSADRLGKLDEDGVVMVGQRVDPGDPLILKLSPRKLTEDDIVRGNISAVFKNPLSRDEKTWSVDTPGIVDRVVKKNGIVKVYIRTEEPAQVGDKLSNRHQAKGVITSIIPDAEMPRDAQDQIIDIIQNSAAVPSRINIGQVLEAQAGLIAMKEGKPFYASEFNGDGSDADNPRNIDRRLRELGMTDAVPLYEANGEQWGDDPIMVGNQYFTRQKQQAEKYFQVRNREDPYDIISRRPIKGPKIGPLGFYALLAHGATENLKEIATIKSELNDEYWQALETGQALPNPKSTFAFDKLRSFMQAAGIQVRKEGSDYRLVPLTDKDILDMSSGEPTDPGRAVRIGQPGKFEMLQPQPGGLYDRKVFGGLDGDRWGHISLAEPMPNPIFEEPIRILLGLSQAEYNGLVRGDLQVDKAGGLVPFERKADGRVSGGAAFERLLGAINVDSELEKIRPLIVDARGAAKDKLIKQARYLAGLKRAGVSPVEGYILHYLPILPPKFRPVYSTARGDLRISDFTMLYQDTGRLNSTLKEATGIPQDVRGDLRGDLYDSMKALQVSSSGSNSGPRQRMGLLEFLKGFSPTSGHFQDKIFSKRQSVGGRAVIMPNPSLGVDEIGMPEDAAWNMYKSFVMRRLSQLGNSPLEAKRLIETRHPTATAALDMEMRERPVMLTRDPRLHKFNHLAFMAHRIPGKAIELPPLVCRGFNADFDGDAMGFSVPVTPEAVHEAKTRLMPSQNLFKAGKDTVIMRPEEDSIAGLYNGTRIARMTQKTYANESDALRDMRDRAIRVNDGIRVAGVVTTPGRIMVNHVLPENLRNNDMVMDDKKVTEVLNRVASGHTKRYVSVLENLKALGDDFAHRTGMTFRLKDFYPMDTSELAGMKPGQTITPEMRSKIQKKLKDALGENSTMTLFANSGAKGNWNSIQQILYSPIQVEELGGGSVPHVIQNGYAKGLDVMDYWMAAKAGRGSLYASSIEVRDPGYFSKQLVRSTLGMTVKPGDVEPAEGIEYDVTHPTVLSRYLAAPVMVGKKMLARAGDPITPELVNAAKAAGVKTFSVRSPLTSLAEQGIYAKDFGRLPGNQTPQTGTDLGIVSAHTLTEPAVQLALKSFHGGGMSSANKKITGLYAIWPLLNGAAPAGAEATLSPFDGVVKSTERLKSGGYRVSLASGEQFSTPPTETLWIKPGDSLKAGQQIHEGYASPKEILKYQGLRPLQMYLVDQIEQNYGNNAPDRRYIETVVAGLTRYARVEDPGSREDILPGDIVAANEIEQYNRSLSKDGRPVVAQPMFTGMDMALPEVETDWLVKMLGRDMIQQLQRAAGFGLTSGTHSPKPIMPYVYGLEFGDSLNRSGDY